MIDRSTHVSVFEGSDERVLIDDLASGGVDDDGALLERADDVLADEPLGVGVEREMDAEDVGLGEHGFEVGDVLAPGGGGGVPAPGMVEDAHGEGVGEVGEAGADPAESEDAEGASGEVVCAACDRGGFPCPGAEGALAVGELADGGEDEVECCGGCCVVDDAGGVGYGDAWDR